MKRYALTLSLAAGLLLSGIAPAWSAERVELTDEQMNELVLRSYQYVAMVDVTEEPIVIEMPAFDSKYVSLMVTGYDHYVNIPMSTGDGDTELIRIA